MASAYVGNVTNVKYKNIQLRDKKQDPDSEQSFVDHINNYFLVWVSNPKHLTRWQRPGGWLSHKVNGAVLKHRNIVIQKIYYLY